MCISEFYILNHERYLNYVRQFVGKTLLNFILIDIEPNRPITLALADDVMNFISSITQEGIKSKYSFWQCKLYCIQAWNWLLDESIWCRDNEVWLHLYISVYSSSFYSSVSLVKWDDVNWWIVWMMPACHERSNACFMSNVMKNV